MMTSFNCVEGVHKELLGNKYGIRDTSQRATKSDNQGVTCMKIGNLLDDFKIDIIGTLSSQWDILWVK